MDNRLPLRRLGVILAYPLAYAYVRLMFVDCESEFIINISGLGLKFSYSFPLVALLFIIVNEIVRRGRRGADSKLTTPAIFWYLMTFLSGLTATIGPDTVLSIFAMHLCAVYSVLVSNDILLGGKTSGFIVPDLIHGFYVKSFAGFPFFFSDWGTFKRKKEVPVTEAAPNDTGVGTAAAIAGKGDVPGTEAAPNDTGVGTAAAIAGKGDVPGTEAATKKNHIGAVLFILIMIGLFVIAIEFMASIDKDIASFLEGLSNRLYDYFFELDLYDLIMRLFVAIPICLYLYGLMARSANSDGSGEKRVSAWLTRINGKGKTVSERIVYVAAGVFVVAYILFMIKRLAYMLGGFSGTVPEGYLVSRYAREGFFELVGIMAVNMCVYIAIILLGKTDSEGKHTVPAKILVTLLMVESIIFAIVAMSKLALYYSVYGYTPKRILAMWATLALGFAASMTITTVLRGKPHFRAGVIFTTVSYILICILSAVLSVIG